MSAYLISIIKEIIEYGIYNKNFLLSLLDKVYDFIKPNKNQLILQESRSKCFYEPYQSISDMFLYGSRNLFCTDCLINGEYFRKKSSNEYYNIVSKNISVEDMIYIGGFFHKEHFIRELKNCKFSNDKHIIIKLIFDNNKAYFVEANQNISVKYPNFVVIQNISSVDDFINNLEPFVPIPE